jgi:hypothetical protein
MRSGIGSWRHEGGVRFVGTRLREEGPKSLSSVVADTTNPFAVTQE